MNIFKKYKIKYEQDEKNHNKCITKCNIAEGNIRVGSIMCNRCEHFVGQDFKNKIVICRKKQG